MKDMKKLMSPVEGIWQNIRWMPSLSTGEVLNLGVLFVANDGTRHVRLLDSVERIKCMYEATVAQDARFLLTVIEGALRTGGEVPTPHVILSEGKYASGPSLQEVVDGLFRHTVPLARPRREDVASTAASPAEKSDYRKIVFDELRRIAGLKADRVISSEGTLEVRDGGISHFLDIPLQSGSALGTIISTRVHRTRAELNLFRADSDLQIARRVYGRDQLLMYVVRPGSGPGAEQMDRLLDDFSWKFKKVGVEMKSYSDPSLIATDVVSDMIS